MRIVRCLKICKHILTVVITGLPVSQPSCKMGSVFPSGTMHSGVFSACAKYKSMCRIAHRTSAGYIPRSWKRLKAISNLSSVEAYECQHTNVNAVHGKPTVKDGKSTFLKWYSSSTILCERPIYKRTLPSESFIEKPCTLSELPTELQALKESPE